MCLPDKYIPQTSVMELSMFAEYLMSDYVSIGLVIIEDFLS